MLYFFFFNDTATTEIYTLSLHDALPIYDFGKESLQIEFQSNIYSSVPKIKEILSKTIAMRDEKKDKQLNNNYNYNDSEKPLRSEEHTSELQSRQYLVCRLLLEKKKKITH